MRLRGTKLDEIIRLLEATSYSLGNAIALAADHTGTLRKEQLQAMKARVDADIDMFERSYSQIVVSGISEETSLIIDRNGQVFIEAEGTAQAVGMIHDTILRDIINYKEKDGLVLSDRVWRLSQEAKADITNRIQQGILLGESHVRVARDVRQYVKGGALRYKSERLAMTEMAKAYKHANEQSVQMMRETSRFMWFEKWELSPAHKKPDVCDILATQDIEGEGAGIYEKAPNRHPGCYCYIYPVYREKRTQGNYPNVSTMEPKTEGLGKGQYRLAQELTG